MIRAPYRPQPTRRTTRWVIITGTLGFYCTAYTPQTMLKPYSYTIGFSNSCFAYRAALSFQRNVFCVVPNPKFRNVAWLKPAFQISTYTDQHGTYPARLANDGSRRTGDLYCAASEPATNPWWSVDLGVPTTVFFVKLTSRGDNNGITHLGIALFYQLRIKAISH